MNRADPIADTTALLHAVIVFSRRPLFYPVNELNARLFQGQRSLVHLVPCWVIAYDITSHDRDSNSDVWFLGCDRTIAAVNIVIQLGSLCFIFVPMKFDTFLDRRGWLGVILLLLHADTPRLLIFWKTLHLLEKWVIANRSGPAITASNATSWDVFHLYSLFRCFPSAIKKRQSKCYISVLYALTTVATAVASF